MKAKGEILKRYKPMRYMYKHKVRKPRTTEESELSDFNATMKTNENEMLRKNVRELREKEK